MMTGNTASAISQFVKREQIERPAPGMVYADDPKVCEYIAEWTLKKKTAVKAKAGSRSDKAVMRTTSSRGELTQEEQEVLENNRRKLEAEMRKMEASAEEKEIKNRILRGGLGNIRFLESLFYQQLNYAIRQFITLPQNTMDDIVSMVLADGKRARTECVNLQNEMINQIGEATKAGWRKNLKRIESELVKLEDQGKRD